MARFFLRRLLETVPLLLLLSLLIFALFELIPGDYLSEMELNPGVSGERIEQLRRDYGLDEPFYRQYLRWAGQTLSGNFGYSFAQQRPAAGLIGDRLGNTLILTLGAFLLTLLLSLPAAIISALTVGKWPDRAGLLLSLAGLSIPTVLMALLLLYFAFYTGWFPIGGSGSAWHLILPSLTLALPMVAFFTRTLRLELIDCLRQPYVTAATARGLPRWRVVGHALRNALNPLISLSGVIVGGLLSGSVVVEKVFSWPGLGALTVASIIQRDLYVALNCVLVASLLIIISNLATDVLLAWNDPRIRYQ